MKPAMNGYSISMHHLLFIELLCGTRGRRENIGNKVQMVGYGALLPVWMKGLNAGGTPSASAAPVADVP